MDSFLATSPLAFLAATKLRFSPMQSSKGLLTVSSTFQGSTFPQTKEWKVGASSKEQRRAGAQTVLQLKKAITVMRPEQAAKIWKSGNLVKLEFDIKNVIVPIRCSVFFLWWIIFFPAFHVFITFFFFKHELFRRSKL